MREGRPKIELPSPATDTAPTMDSVLDRLGRMLIEIRDAPKPLNHRKAKLN